MTRMGTQVSQIKAGRAMLAVVTNLLRAKRVCYSLMETAVIIPHCLAYCQDMEDKQSVNFLLQNNGLCTIFGNVMCGGTQLIHPLPCYRSAIHAQTAGIGGKILRIFQVIGKLFFSI